MITNLEISNVLSNRVIIGSITVLGIVKYSYLRSPSVNTDRLDRVNKSNEDQVGSPSSSELTITPENINYQSQSVPLLVDKEIQSVPLKIDEEIQSVPFMIDEEIQSVPFMIDEEVSIKPYTRDVEIQTESIEVSDNEFNIVDELLKNKDMRRNLSEIQRIIDWSSDVKLNASSKGNIDELKIENLRTSYRSGDIENTSATKGINDDIKTDNLNEVKSNIYVETTSAKAIRINEDQYPIVRNELNDQVDKQIKGDIDVTDEIINNILNN
jgi:hypothetical protein